VIADLQEWLIAIRRSCANETQNLRPRRDRRVCGQRCTAQKGEAARRDRSIPLANPVCHRPSPPGVRSADTRRNSGNLPCPGRYRKRPGQLPPRLARSPAGWQLARGAGYTAGLVSGPAQAGQAQVGGAQITNPIVTGGSSGPAEYLGGDIGDTPA
jgi:hypothetical protein